MIKVENDTITISGDVLLLQAEFVGVVKELVDATKGKIDRVDIEYCVEIAFMSDEEKIQHIHEMVKTHTEILNLLNDAIGSDKKDKKESDKSDAVATMDSNLMKDIIGRSE